jgi:hypothetical protein
LSLLLELADSPTKSNYAVDLSRLSLKDPTAIEVKERSFTRLPDLVDEPENDDSSGSSWILEDTSITTDNVVGDLLSATVTEDLQGSICSTYKNELSESEPDFRVEQMVKEMRRNQYWLPDYLPVSAKEGEPN